MCVVKWAYEPHCLRMADMVMRPGGHFLFALSIFEVGDK